MASVPSYQRFASPGHFRTSSLMLLLPQLATTWAPSGCMFGPLRASGQSSQKVEKSNRRSKFGESVLVYPFEEDDLPVCLIRFVSIGTSYCTALLKSSD